ncbi:phage tail protein [Metapseudomonas otitidis]|uniref:phage tail protein n=1 Tax=Metapseudomonas otitidis TaxID=319939 RepID=UPI00244BEC47|nr:phage tail protein [Pseudomonas otitidis]MDG9780259.1 phage tail protein [Pseudomonas otitidis]
MSSGGQIAGGIIGAVVGFYAGGPAGALYGASLGMGIGGYLDPPKGPTVEGPRLNDLKVQTSTYGVIVPRVYGMIGISGNVLWLENNQLKETVKKKKQGGKGGGSSSTLKTYSYSATFALGLCEGPIAGVRRIWCGDKLIYNAGSDDIETIVASNNAAAGFRVYLGTDNQLPDSRYEANVGAGNAPALRGLAYIVFYDFQLGDYGNSLQGAQFKVEVYKSGEISGANLIRQISSVYASSPGAGATGSISVFDENLESHWVINELEDWFLISSSSAGKVRREKIQGSYRAALSGNVDFAKYCVVASDGLSINVGGKIYQTPSLYFSTSLNQIFISGNNAILYSYYSGRSLHVLPYLDGAGVSKEIFGTSPAIYNNIVYTLSSSGNKLELFDSTTLEQLSDVIIDSDTAISVSYNRNAQIINGVYWIVDNLAILYGIKIDTGEIAHIEQLPDSVPLYNSVISVDGGLISFSYADVSFVQHTDTYRLAQSSDKEFYVSDVISNEVDGSNILGENDIDVSQILSTIAGFKVSGGSIRSAIEPLQGAFPFDVRQHGYNLQCVPRGQSSVASVSEDDLGASGDGSDKLIEVSREMDSQLPVRTTIKYIDASREYDTAEQYSERINTKAVNRVDREFPIVMSANKAAQVAEILEFSPWIERSEYKFTLPPTMLGVEPADVISVSTEEALYEFRLVETNENPDGSIECKARPNKASLWSSTASGGESPGPDGVIGLDGSTLFITLDIPVVDEVTQNSAGFVAVASGYLSSWPGAVIFRSSDGGQTWDDLQGFPGKCIIGRVRSKLLTSSSIHIDQSSIVVDMISGEISSVTRDQMLSGKNYVAYGANGRWEIIRFQNATLQADGSYVVSGFVRGEFGTEWATGLHAESDWFVFLSDPDNQFIGMTATSIGQQFLYRGVTNGADILSAYDQPFTYSGVNLECLSPVYARGYRDGSGNFTGSFTRRSRVSGTWWVTGTPSPVGESAESYEIDVMSGATVKRTIASTSESFSYSAANQSADFGSAQSAITFRIYQMSAVVGRGYPLEVTL